MPLIRKKTKKAFIQNLKELLSTYKRKGKIGNIKPKNIADARRTALAIAFKIRRGK